MKHILRELSRRQLLAYLGAPVLFWPLLRTLRETQAFGAPGDDKRAIFVFYPSGHANGHFHPDGTNNFPAMTQPLTEVKSDVLIPVGINYSSIRNGPDGDRHATGARYCLTGAPDLSPSISIDNYLGQFFKSQSRFPQLRLGVGSGKNNRTAEYSMSFEGNGSIAVVQDNPGLVFRQLYGGDPATMGNPANGLQKSLLDQNLRELKRLQLALGNLEKEKLEQHIESVRELERRLAKASTPGANQCPTPPVIPPEFSPTAPDGPRLAQDDGRMPQVSDLMVDLAIHALACGMTKVIYLQFAFPVCYSTFLGTNQPHHEISHYFENNGAGDKLPKFIQCQSFYMSKIASLIKKAKAVIEGDRTMLFNTALLAVSEHGDTTSHSKDNLGIVLAGQAGGAWKTGRYLNAGGDSHNKILVSILQAMGMQDNFFGRNDITGGLAGLAG